MPPDNSLNDLFEESSNPADRFRNGRTPDWVLLRALYVQGLDFPALAQRSEAKGASVKVIRRRAENEGWTRNVEIDGGGRARVKKKKPKQTQADREHQARIKKISDRQRRRMERLSDQYDDLADMYEQWKRMDSFDGDPDTDVDEKAVLGTRLFGLRDTEVDFLSKLSRLGKEITAAERAAYGMDKGNEDKSVKPFVPMVARRGAPGVEDEDEDEDEDDLADRYDGGDE